jgi:hypothetical protein
MIILLIAEIRSGSTNLAKWLKESLPGFQLLNEPYNPKSSQFIGDSEIDTNKNYIISEKFFNNEPLLNKLIGISDFVICLYREDITSQTESYIIADATNNWYDVYVDDIISKNIDVEFGDKKNSFIKLKKDFQSFISDSELKSFTYEKLYYGEQITELKNYLNITSNITFPYGQKYRQFDIKKSIV